MQRKKKIYMKARLTQELIEKLSGPMGLDHYASNAPGEPGWVIIKKRPGPRNPKGKRTNLWVMPEGQAKGVRLFKATQTQASEEYANPEKRAQWQAEYVAWKSEQRRHGKDGYKLNGKLVRYLWDYIRIRVQEQNRSVTSR